MALRLLDSHFHFWRIGKAGQSWPDQGWPRLYRDFLPCDLHEETNSFDFLGGVLVQSQPDDRDTDWMLALDDSLVRAVVGWVDLIDSEAPRRIAALAVHPKLRGLRPMLQSTDDTDWILQPAIAPAIEAMLSHGLRFDALVQPRHLPVLESLARRWPDLPIVIDHAAKPNAARGELDPWREKIAALAQQPNIWCKLSGLRTEQAPGQDASELEPYVLHLLESFGERLMWGSDWPVLRHAGDSYADWVQTTIDLAGPLGADRIACLFENAARTFYAIDV